MVLLGALDNARDEAAEPRFVLKGGLAIELRLGLQARTTKDVDIVFRGDPARMRETLEEALAAGYPPFEFRLAESEAIRDTRAERMDVKITFNGRDWATLQVEISPEESKAGEVELVEAISIGDLGLQGPERVACQSLRYQIATKLHAVTERFDGEQNDRYRDLVDLILLRDLAPDLGDVKAACEDIFSARRKQPWPPSLDPEPSWSEHYRVLAARFEFPIDDLDDAIVEVRQFIAEIDQAPRPAKEARPSPRVGHPTAAA